ncbi:MAG: T9SS type A sorting domain-containing protein [Flavobacteriales bacterium]|nr:T9SS type A sorting domain-containing protein [Flavobacteriales bacterium]
MAIGKLRAATYGRGIWEADLFFSPFASVTEIGASTPPRIVPIDHEGRFRLNLAQEHGALRQVRVMDASGRMVLEQRAATGIIDLSARAASAYIVQVITDRGLWNQRLVR